MVTPSGWCGLGGGRWLEGHDGLKDLIELKRIFPTDHVKQLKLITLGKNIRIYIYYMGCFLFCLAECFEWFRSICLDPRVFPLAALFHLQG